MVKRTLRTEELSRDVQGLASHNDDLLAIEQLLSNSACQPTEEMTLAIDRDLCHTVESASIAQIALILDPQSFFHRVDNREMRSGAGDLRLARRSTFLSCFTMVRRQMSEGLPVSSTFVMVEGWCRFVVSYLNSSDPSQNLRVCASLLCLAWNLASPLT